MVNSSSVVRFGGISGILFVVLIIPTYIVGYPDASKPASSTQGVLGYFDAVGAFLFFNVVLSIFAAFFLGWFIGILHGVLRSAESTGWRRGRMALLRRLGGRSNVHNAHMRGGSG